MKRFPKWVLLLALAAPMYAQTLGSFTGNATQPANNVPAGAAAAIMTVPFATITVCAYPAVNSPCTNAVPIFFDQAGAQPLTQPITTDATGRFAFWVASGTYSYSVMNQAGAVVGTYPFTVGGTGGGGSGCTLGSVPDTAVVYNNAGNCAGSLNFITNSTGNAYISGGGSLEVDSPTSGSDYWLFNGDHTYVQSDAHGPILPGIDFIVSDAYFTGPGTGIIPIFISYDVERDGKNGIGVEVIGGAGGAANSLVGVEVDALAVPGSVVNATGYFAGMRGDVASGEEFNYIAETRNGGTPSAGYCDFMARDSGVHTLHESLGCGPTHTNTFNGTVQISTATFSTLPACISGLEGTMRPVTDSTTNTWGATIAGGSTNHVLAYCDGSAWTVAAK
jgi:hypothetical protein